MDIGKNLEAVYSDQVSVFICSIIVIWFLIFSLLLISKKMQRSRIIAITPSILATLGVLGTFIGIFIGLLDFDVSNIDKSVPNLLNGLKTAFITSIFGMIASVSFRIIQAVRPSEKKQTGVSGDDIHQVLTELRDDGRANNKISNELMQQVRNSISSDGETSLLTQIQKMRTAIQDGQSELIKEFREFSKHMVENNQKAIIEALEAVIKDFNTKITEQFGDNFKQLNEAVGKMVAWQDRYKNYVESVEKIANDALKSIVTSEQALASVKAHASSIPAAMQGLSPIMTALQAQVTGLQAHMEALGELRTQAVDALPIVQENMRKLTDDLGAHISDAIKRTENAMELQHKGLEQLTNSADAAGQKFHTEFEGALETLGAQSRDVFENHARMIAQSTEEMQTQIRNTLDIQGKGVESLTSSATMAQEKFRRELEIALEGMSKQSIEAFESHGQMIDQTSKAVQDQVREAWHQTADKINDQMTELDQQMQKELGRALELMGKNLASISEKFVNDYEPLTHQLRQVVALANKGGY